MNEQVIDDLFNQAVSKGYKKSREEFVNLLHTNDAVLNDMYSYVQSKGYQKGIEDFNGLVGKKKGVTGSSTVDGTLALQSGEKDTALERTFGKNPVTDFFGDIYRSYEAGSSKVENIDPTMNIFGKKASEIDDESLKSFVESANKLSKTPVTDEMRQYQKDVEQAGGGFLNSIIQAVKNPGIIPQLVVDSFSMMVPVTDEGVSSYALAGAAAAGGAGATLGGGLGALGGPLAPISVTAGAAAGGLRGLMAGMSATTEVALSYGQYLQEEAQKRGLEFNEQNVKKLLEDQAVVDGATNRALSRGATIGLVDVVTSGFAGKALGATKAAVKGTTGKVLGTGAALTVESVGEGAGEGAAQVVSGQEVSGEEIALEMLGGVGGGVFNVAVENLVGTEKIGRYKINGEEVSKNRLNRFLQTATPDEVAKTNIEITDDNDVLAIAEDKKKEALLASQIDPAVTEETDKSRLVKLEKERAKLKGLDTKSAQNRVKAIDEEIDSITGKYTLEEKPAAETIEYKIDGSKMDRARFVAAVDEAKNEEALNELETTDPEVQKVIDAKRAQFTGEIQPEVKVETQPVTINVADKYTVDEVDRVKTLPIENEDGATMNLDGTKYEKGGVVIPLASRNLPISELTAEKIDEFVKENSESIGSDMVKVGIYKFPNSDQASIDINIVADRSRRDEAIEIARELGQESIFDLDTFENIKTGADGKNPKVLTPKEFLAIQDRLSRPKQTEVTVTPETSSNYANMTEDNEGNFVFFHVGKKGYGTIKKGTGATAVTSREEASALSKVGGLAMYYTAPEQTERQSADGAKYAVKVPKEKVYDFNTDKLNLIDEARQRHESENPGKAFDTNSQIAYVTKIAGERGFDMVVADWAGGTRAQTTKELTPVDVQESTGNVIEKNFDNQYESNKTKGFTPVVPKRKADKLQALYDKINELRSVEKRYDNLYSLYTDSSKYTQEEITDLIEKSDLPQDIKNEYKEILGSKEETRRSEQKKAAPTNIEESIKNSAKTLQTSFPGVNVIVADNTEDAKNQIVEQLTPIVGEENAKTIADQIETARGQAVFYNGKPIAVVVNKEKAISNTAAHEVWHLILREAFGKNAKKFKSFQNAISRELKSAGYADIADYLDTFSAEYEGDAVYEEYLAELGGLLTTKGFDPKNLTAQEKSILNKIKEIINKFAKSIVGQDVFLKDAKPENILQFMINVSDLIAKGEDVRAAIGKSEAKQLKAGVDVVKQIDVNKVRASNRPGNKISKGLSVSGSGKNKSASETEDLSIEYVKNNSPKIFISNAKIIANYPLVSKKIGNQSIDTVEDAQKVYDIFTEEVSENLIYLMDEFNKEFKDVSSLWYDGANIIANRLASKYDVTPEQAAGIIASLSPQKDWYQNVRLAELVLKSYEDNPVITNKMIEYQVSINKKGMYEGQNAPGKALKKAEAAYKSSRTNLNREALINAKDKLSKAEKKAADLIKMLNKYVGIKLKDAPIFVQPYAVRTYHEINTTKNYDVLTPDGNTVGLAKGTKGENKKVAWGSYSEIGKAVSIYNDNSPENITKSLGEMHKIRNFYNNIIDPMSKDGDVTIDTHAVAAALLKPLSGKSKEVSQNFGTGTSNSSTLGIKGIYYAYSDAYALAAKKTGLLPRQVQSITWEAVRGLYKDTFKSKKENVSEINKIWERYEKGQITISEARELAKEKAGGIENPTWAGGLIQDESREGYGVEGYGSGVVGDGLDTIGDLEVSKQITTDKDAKPGYAAAMAAINQTEEERQAWRKANKVSQAAQRNPIVQQAAIDYYNGLINQEKYLDIVRKNQPIKAFKSVPKLPTITDIVNSLDEKKVAIGIIGATKNIEEGQRVASRLDIPAYSFYDTWVVSVHDGVKEGKNISYGQTAVLKDVNFETFPGRGLNIARGRENKETLARIFGNWVNEDPEAVHERAKKLMDDPEWIQVGMNPFRHSYFYDKTDGMPVVTADEVIQVGALVLAKNAKKVLPSDPKFTTKSAEGLEIQFQKQLPARVNEQVNNIIADQKALGNKPVEIAKEAAKYVKTTDAYKKLGDRDKAKVIGGIKRLSGMRVRVLVDEYANLKDQLRAAEKLSDANKKLPNYKQTLNELVNSVRALVKAGKISTFRAGVIIGRIVKTNLTSPESVNKTINYIADIFDNANLAMKISRAKSLVKNAKRNINSKIGQNPDLFNAGKILVSIDPHFIPTPMIDDYLDIMEVIGERARVLSIKDSGELTAKMNVIINAVINESEDVVNSAEQEKIRMTPEESVVAAQSLIDQIKADKNLETSNIIDVNDAAVARKIASITEKDMMDLLSIDKDGITDFSKLKLLLGIRENIKAGIVTNEAMLMATAVAQNRNVDKLSTVVGKVTGPKILNGVTRTISKIKGAITGKSGVLEAIRSTPLEFIDDVIGNFNDKTIYNLTFGLLGSPKGKLDARLADLSAKADAAEKLLQSAGRTDNAVVEAKYKIMALQLQREFDSNPGSPSVAPAIEFIDATLRAISRKESSLTNSDARILQEVRSQITANGISGLENSLTENDKKAMKLIDEINAAQASEALFTSSVIRGARVNIINNYVHHAVLSKNQSLEAESLINKLLGRGANGKPSTKAGTLNERTPGAKPIMFDPVSASMRGARETLTDFYMTPAIREVTGSLNKLKDKVFDDPNSTQDQKDIAQSLVESVEEALEVTFQNHFSSDTNFEALVKAIQKLGYQTTLASIPRAIAELSSNMSFAILSDPKTTTDALKHTKFAFSSDMLGFLEKIGSSESTRLAGTQILTGKYAEGGFASGYGRTSKSAASSKIMDYASFITRMSIGKLYRVADVTSDLLISTPDKVVSKAYYVADFVNNFEKETGVKLTESDLRKISDGTSEYLSPEYETALQKARQKADSDIVRMAASGNSFNTILKNVPRKKDAAMMSAYRAINSFMSRFYLTEYGTLRSAVIALFKSGQIDKKAATAIIAASVTRMSMYVVAYSLLSSIFDSIIGDALDLEGEDEDDEDLMTRAKRSMVGTGVGVLSRRTLGNIGYTPVAYAIEQLNADLGEDFGLRDGEYDPFKNSLVYSKVSESDLKTKSPYEVLGKAFAGPYAPALSSIARTATLYGRATKEGSKPETQKRAMDELESRMALEAVGNLGLIPLYKDVRRIMMSDFYARNYDKKESPSFTITQKQIDLIRKSNPTAARQLQSIYDTQKAEEKKVRDFKNNLEKQTKSN